MQIEHVARKRFAAGRAAQQQRDLPIGDGLLGQIVIDDQRILAVIHEVLAHGHAAVRRDVLHAAGWMPPAATTMVCAIASCSSSLRTTLAIDDCFWPIAT